MKPPGQTDSLLRHHSGSAFSLVEVVLALGIVAFAMLAVVGLLPVGLQAVKNANEEAAAANVVARISNALRQATAPDGVNYENRFAGTPFGYTVGGTAVSYEWPDLDMDAYTAGDAAKRLSAKLEILQTPTINPATPGRAVITVAWPAAANPQWDAAAKSWSKAEGSITTAIQFSPKP
jgi:uncharacterized protein (TIGR02598 family)